MRTKCGEKYIYLYFSFLCILILVYYNLTFADLGYKKTTYCKSVRKDTMKFHLLCLFCIVFGRTSCLEQFGNIKSDFKIEKCPNLEASNWILKFVADLLNFDDRSSSYRIELPFKSRCFDDFFAIKLKLPMNIVAKKYLTYVSDRCPLAETCEIISLLYSWIVA